MANFVKKVTKHASDKLEPGEAVLGAMLVQPAGSTTWGIAGAATGGALGAAIGHAADKRAREREATTEGPEEAAAFDSQNGIAAITDRRIIFFKSSAGTGKPTDIFFEVPLSELERIEEEGGKGLHDKITRSKRFRFVRNDGKVFTVSAITMSTAKKNIAEFTEAYERSGGRIV